MADAGAALDTARTLLNDDNATTWTDAVLMPKLAEAHRELQVDLWEVGSPVVREESSAIQVDAAATTLSGNQPSNLITPTKLIETTRSGSAWIDMTEVTYIPKNIAQSATLIYWAWREETIVFLGSSANRDVILYYRKLITIPTTVNDAIGVIFGELYLGARTAAMASGSVGNKEVYDILTALAKTNFAKVVNSNRGQQKPISSP